MIALNDEGIKALKTVKGRKIIGQQGFKGFCLAYLRHRFVLAPATFHSELFESIEKDNDFIAILGFRGCAKSTILECYALYALVTGKSKFTVYISATSDKSKAAVRNIKNEIENNKEIQQDFNLDFIKSRYSMQDKWGEGQITIKGHTIIAKSRGESNIRGSLQDGSRISMIICDDLENTENTRSEEIRKKTRSWFFTEVVPATAQGELAHNVKIVLIGNLVHRDCLLAHLDNKALSNGNIIKVLKFPLIDENGESTWKALYPDQAALDKAKQKVMLSGEGMGNVIWAREYLLKMVDEEDQIIKDSEIMYYPDEWLLKKFESGGVGVDLAISQKQTADFTTMVKAVFVRNDYGERRLLILRNPVKEHLTFENTISKAKQIKTEMPVGTVFYVEDVAYQKAAIEIMQKNGVNTSPVKVTSDKRSRLIAASPYIKSGMVLFPKQGAEYILEELIGFGIEPHDDVLDALVHVIDGMLNKPQVICV